MEKAAATLRVSVVIPAYNSAAMLGSCLQTLLGQTMPPWEVIVVDDGSTDETASIAESFGYPVRVFRKEHKDASAARNAGAAESRGDAVLFSDADISFERNALALLVQALNAAPDASFAYCSFRFGHLTFHAPPFDPDRLRRRNYISSMSLIRRRDFVPFDETLSRFQDWDFFLALCKQGKRGIAVPQVLFHTDVGRGKSRRGFGSWFRAYQTIRKKHSLPFDLWSVVRQLVFHFGR